uniref:C-type lectin domain-containing protein n=1 Tax=Sparus aurata TaxID=8175 RepID=A0A671UBJ5_SPAAU
MGSVDKTYQKLSPTSHRVARWCFAIKPSSHYNFHMQFAIYSKLLKHVEGVALNTSTQHIPTAASEPCRKCQEGWEQNGPQCYYFSTDKLIWEKAREKCRRNGAHLVKIESEDEDKMVEDEDMFWIGLTDSVTEGTWLWADGTPLNKRFDLMGTKSRSGLKWWSDKSCTAPQKRICEKSVETGMNV